MEWRNLSAISNRLAYDKDVVCAFIKPETRVLDQRNVIKSPNYTLCVPCCFPNYECHSKYLYATVYIFHFIRSTVRHARKHARTHAMHEKKCHSLLRSSAFDATSNSLCLRDVRASVCFWTPGACISLDAVGCYVYFK